MKNNRLIGTLVTVELDYLVSVGIMGKCARLLKQGGRIVNHIQDDLGLFIPFSPTSNWAHGGPLIAEYSIKNSGNLFLAMRDLWFLHCDEDMERKLEEELMMVKERR